MTLSKKFFFFIFLQFIPKTILNCNKFYKKKVLNPIT